VNAVLGFVNDLPGIGFARARKLLRSAPQQPSRVIFLDAQRSARRLERIVLGQREQELRGRGGHRYAGAAAASASAG
jgi:hypothetical protein